MENYRTLKEIKEDQINGKISYSKIVNFNVPKCIWKFNEVKIIKIVLKTRIKLEDFLKPQFLILALSVKLR